MARLAVIGASFACLAGLGAAETYVLPVVARGVPGKNGSYWDSEVRISGPNLSSTGGDIKRVWVALPGGGFLDDPAAAPRWGFPSITCPGPCPDVITIVVLTGDQLLQGTDAPKGAVALEIEGTGNHVFLHNANTLGQPRLPQDDGGPPCCLPGNGQLIRALREPLIAQGFVPWIASGRSPYRVSVGVINPTPQSRTIAIALDHAFSVGRDGSPPDGTYWLGNPVGLNQSMLTIDLPPWGFRQIDDLASVMLQRCPSCAWLDRVAPAAIYLVDSDTQLPFYAYASVIWTPLNDPEFVAAVPLTQ